ncbi:RNA polymerase-associated protein RapA [Ralstonia mannitolilytica]|uniref:helicase-related protein n=1 Tax=Ralstonia mannitolilytica TaxID=105219 RepID=UPI0028F6172C|nr:helicase-related protein [Ralstonia mannitolilytica]CAJ0681547.1 RNA polymerase-associated protein RapA [Ralstonia mannitolilytica]CAJ0719176.1 RNA polymerase-associated protein RapA [Ralstonia mannitolilytica]
MSQGFKGWSEVAKYLSGIANGNAIELNDGQRASLRAIAKKIPKNGVIIADEVGMGKTRIAATVAHSVISAGGRVAILVPPGLGYQWGDELRTAGVETPLILRSLWQYLQAWESKEKQHPWFNEPAVLISHAFTNWRLGENSSSWRWALLPELYARWRKLTEDRFPRHYHGHEKLNDEWVKHAAESIAEAINASPKASADRALIKELVEQTPWPGALDAGEYARNSQLRPWLERAVGLGMGVFDLVIIDEAHKSRGQDSGLTRLVEHVVLQSAVSRRLAMTATPVELDVEQWKQTLGRIKVDSAQASEAIKLYADAVRKVRQCPNDSQTREAYKKAAEEFKQALSPYLLRRDKREDEFVQKFRDHSKEGFHAYRREREILIDTAGLSPAWKQAVCAAEALSFVTRQSDDSVAKRLRLTLGNGHGLAALIDQMHRHEEDDKKQSEADGAPNLSDKCDERKTALPDKRLLRAQWWQKVMMQPSYSADSGDSALYDHPAILAAVNAIEEVTQEGEKVLVFGRFTRPLRALVDLLNAREMLRCLDAQQAWPQSKVIASEWAAIIAAHRQLERSGQLSQEDLNKRLDQQYRSLELQRRKIRENLIKNIEGGIKKHSERMQALFFAFKKDVSKIAENDQDNDEHALAVVARAVKELIGPDIDSATPDDFATAFANIVDAASDRDEGDADGNGELDADEANELWSNLVPRLHDEYSRPEGGFARLMYGETKPATRRFLQLAFNRKHGHPKVLVAQSVVGREGLNLHKACRTVVLLHPEWNPGAVEQQIGRVDRIGSLWQSKLDEAINKSVSDAIPRIEVRPVIFRGTYDEKNWQVLRDRWDDLRAQLHGIVISPRFAENYQDATSVIAEINAAAPNFSPTTVSCCRDEIVK